MEKKGKKYFPTFNIITLGDSGCGKTSIINRYAKYQFEDNMASTFGINFVYKKLIVKKKNYFKKADAVLFVFSLDDKESFNSIKYWVDEFNNNNDREDIPKYLIGNKNDLEINVEQTLIDEFVKENKIPFISTSARTNTKIDELFEEIGKKLYIHHVLKDYVNDNDNDNGNKRIKPKPCCQ